MANVEDFGEYLVFVDESGDHELASFDPSYPVFVLLFLIVSKKDYANEICPQFLQFKMRHWGHPEVVLHEHEIRKPRDDFSFLQIPDRRECFHRDLSELMAKLKAKVLAVIIDKPRFVQQYHDPANPYDYALEVGLERVWKQLQADGQEQKHTPVIVESRGRREDAELELAFRRIADGENFLRKQLPLSIRLVSKLSNSIGLQIADLMARPVGIHHLRPDQKNRAYEILEPKLRRSPQGKIAGWGLKIIP